MVAADILSLRVERTEDITNDALRRLSPVLRRLLVERDLQQAWRTAGFESEPVIEAFSLNATVAGFSLDRVVFAAVGSERPSRGDALHTVMITSGNLDDDLRTLSRRDRPWKQPFCLSAFCKGACLIIGGEPISRAAVVKHVANKLGGEHFDSWRSNRSGERSFRLLDSELTTGTIHRREVIYFQLLAIGQSVGRSEDLNRFVERVRR